MTSPFDPTTAPNFIQKHLKRIKWSGNELVPGCVIVYGWIFRRPKDDEMDWQDYEKAKVWFRENGFTFSGGKWGRVEWIILNNSFLKKLVRSGWFINIGQKQSSSNSRE